MNLIANEMIGSAFWIGLTAFAVVGIAIVAVILIGFVVVGVFVAKVAFRTARSVRLARKSAVGTQNQAQSRCNKLQCANLDVLGLKTNFAAIAGK